MNPTGILLDQYAVVKNRNKILLGYGVYIKVGETDIQMNKTI